MSLRRRYGTNRDTCPFLDTLQALPAELALLHIENDIGIDVLAIDAYLKMKVLRSGTPRASGQGDGRTGLNPVAGLDEVLAVVAIDGFQSVDVANHDYLAITAVGFGHAHHTSKGSIDRVARTSLQVCPAMRASVAGTVCRNDFGLRQRKAPVRGSKTIELDEKSIALGEQTGSLYTDMGKFCGSKRGLPSAVSRNERRKKKTKEKAN